MPNERKPHLLKVKRDIVALVDREINDLKKGLLLAEDLSDSQQDYEGRRTIAIWIKQRNRLAKDAELAETPLLHKTGQGKLIWMGD